MTSTRVDHREQCDYYRAAVALNSEVHDILAAALHYPLEGPGDPGFSPEQPSYVTGDHVAQSLAAEAATRIRELEAQIAALENRAGNLVSPETPGTMAGVGRELTRRQDAGTDESSPEVLVDDLRNGRHDLLPGSILLDSRGELHQLIDDQHLLDERGVTHRPAALQIVFRPLGGNWIAAPPTSGFLGGHFWTES